MYVCLFACETKLVMEKEGKKKKERCDGREPKRRAGIKDDKKNTRKWGRKKGHVQVLEYEAFYEVRKTGNKKRERERTCRRKREGGINKIRHVGYKSEECKITLRKGLYKEEASGGKTTFASGNVYVNAYIYVCFCVSIFLYVFYKANEESTKRERGWV